MKILKNLSFAALILALTFITMSCNGDDDKKDPTDPRGSCSVQLFDGDNFTDDNITVKGPGEFPSLENLPGSSKNWNDEADSFKASSQAIITLWTETEFRGDSITYEAGAEKPSVDEPSSMKIRCK